VTAARLAAIAPLAEELLREDEEAALVIKVDSLDEWG
jgi:hypothetical protein